MRTESEIRDAEPIVLFTVTTEPEGKSKKKGRFTYKVDVLSMDASTKWLSHAETVEELLRELPFKELEGVPEYIKAQREHVESLLVAVCAYGDLDIDEVRERATSEQLLDAYGRLFESSSPFMAKKAAKTKELGSMSPEQMEKALEVGADFLKQRSKSKSAKPAPAKEVSGK